jgi:hypothetical protein
MGLWNQNSLKWCSWTNSKPFYSRLLNLWSSCNATILFNKFLARLIITSIIYMFSHCGDAISFVISYHPFQLVVCWTHCKTNYLFVAHHAFHDLNIDNIYKTTIIHIKKTYVKEVWLCDFQNFACPCGVFRRSLITSSTHSSVSSTLWTLVPQYKMGDSNAMTSWSSTPYNGNLVF